MSRSGWGLWEFWGIRKKKHPYKAALNGLARAREIITSREYQVIILRRNYLRFGIQIN